MAPSGRGSSAIPTTRWCCSPARRSAAGRSSGSRAGPRTTRARSTAATTSPISRSRATRDGEITGLRVKTLANLGGRLSTIGPGVPTTLYGRVLTRLLQDPQRLCRRSPASTRTRPSSTPIAAQAGRRRPMSSSARWTCSRRRSGWTAPRSGAGTSSSRTSSRTTTRPVSGSRRAAPRSTSIPATTSRPWTRRSQMAGYADLAAEEGRGQDPRQAARHRPVDLHRGLRRRADRSGSARSARAGAPRCGNRPTSRCT